jgi:hypothetical protein
MVIYFGIMLMVKQILPDMRFILIKNDFINRTKPKALLLEGQRYAFSEYCIQQNNLIAVTVEK